MLRFMKVNRVIKILIKYRLHYLAYFLLSVASILLGRFSLFKLIEDDLWLQKQGQIFFFDYTPNYRLKQNEIDSLSNEIFFNSYLPKKKDICVDIGAGLGHETRLMSIMTGHEGKVFSIEATKKTYKALEECVYYNKLHNVTLSHCAITNKKGPVMIADDIGHHTENKIIVDEGSSSLTVRGLTMDQYLEYHNIEYVDYMKINIEGAEKLLIEKFKKIKSVKNIAISSHDFLGHRTGDNFTLQKT